MMENVNEVLEVPAGKGRKPNETKANGNPPPEQNANGETNSNLPLPENNAEKEAFEAEKKRLAEEREKFLADQKEFIARKERFEKREQEEKLKADNAAAMEAARLQKEQEEKERQSVPTPPVVPMSNYKVPAKANRVFILEGGNLKGNHTIMAVEDVIDPATGNPRRARLIRGATSIWMDEQKQFETTKGWVEKNQRSLVFSKGKLIVNIHDTLLNQFIDLSNRNKDNENRNKAVVMKEYFYEWNTEKQANAEIEAEATELEALRIAASAEIEDLIPHAKYLGVDFYDRVSGHDYLKLKI